jgi:hypothetical protein
MMSKAANVLLIFLLPSFLGYPAALNVDPRAKRSPQPEETTAEIWPALPPAAVASPQVHWLMIQARTEGARPLEGEFLTKELQRQLRRVGCYGGDINGVWTQSTRRAMQTFTNRVNATLPLDRPDHVFLAMLQGNPDKLCNKPCPLGENLAADGRCVPGTIAGASIKTTAPSHAKPAPLVTRWIATEAATSDDDTPMASKTSRAPLTAAPVRPSPAPKRETAAKQLAQRPRVATDSRERPRTSQRSDREQSRTSQHTEFVRTFFQRLDGSGR